MFNALAIREMQMKTAMRYHYTPKEQLSLKIVPTTNSSEDADKIHYSYIAGGNVKY